MCKVPRIATAKTEFLHFRLNENKLEVEKIQNPLKMCPNSYLCYRNMAKLLTGPCFCIAKISLDMSAVFRHSLAGSLETRSNINNISSFKYISASKQCNISYPDT